VTALPCVCGVPVPKGVGEVTVFASLLQHLAVLFPESIITSWQRSVEKNAEVGGAPDSLHLSGLAADFDISLADRARLVEFGRAAEALGLAAIVYDTATKNYVHVQARPLLSGATFSEVFA